MAQRFDREVLDSIGARVIEVPNAPGRYMDLDEGTARWLRDRWDDLFPTDAPEVFVLGGWPFFASIQVIRARASRSMFIDCGAVPMDGLAGPALEVQLLLRSLRRQHLPSCDAIAPISNFIDSTQSSIDAPLVCREVVGLGADHLESRTCWPRGIDSVGERGGAIAQESAGVKLRILNLGRWEPATYKGSELAFDVLRRLRERGIGAHLSILANPAELAVPPGLEHCTVAEGYPDDRSMAELMRAADIGIAMSRWEGFNLPLAEMQHAGRPVFAIAGSAHDEVIAHPDFLCSDPADMAARIESFVDAGTPSSDEWAAAMERKRYEQRWARAFDSYERILRSLLDRAPRPASVLMDVTNACRDTANSGVIRVTRRLARELQKHVVLKFAVWCAERGRYVAPTDVEYKLLTSFNGPEVDDSHSRSESESRRAEVELTGLREGWLLFSETVDEARASAARAMARESGLGVASVFYDAIPVVRPDLVTDSVIRENHAGYMRGLAEVDLVVPISEYSARSLIEFWMGQGIAPRARVETVLLPGEFPGYVRQTGIAVEPRQGRVEILCVSTLEPRKNHRRLLRALERMDSEAPGLDWRVTLVGNRYSGGEEIVSAVQAAASRDDRIQWLGVVDDETLSQLYRGSHFSIYCSEIEGFGLPVLESLWHGTPVLCHNGGVMSELAVEGGCRTVDMSDEASVSAAIREMTTDKRCRQFLRWQAANRTIKTWDRYGREFAQRFCIPLTAFAAAGDRGSLAPADWREIIYPGCLIDGWQMNESEKLALTALLERLKPMCAIEIGTFRGGSLSLIRQYARHVFSIDIDPSVAERFGHFENVSFLTGPSDLVMPVLLRELDCAGLHPGLILVDGDHSSEGVRRDIEVLLTYQPKVPMFVVMHDGFNPKCREGMLAARWERCPFLRWVDVDFVPGRIVEHGGGGDGEMWGGLALAYLSPERSSEPPRVIQSARKAFELARAHCDATQ
jgi:glycosyltransferase involved in cell wall biosynthesis